MKPTYEELELKIIELENKIDDMEDKLENFTYAFSETVPDWKTRCYRMGSALGYDFGDPDWLLPDQRNKYDEMEQKLKAFQEAFSNIDFITLNSLRAYLRVSQNGGMPCEIANNVVNIVEHMCDLQYLKYNLAQYIHERIDDGSKEAH